MQSGGTWRPPWRSAHRRHDVREVPFAAARARGRARLAASHIAAAGRRSTAPPAAALAALGLPGL